MKAILLLFLLSSSPLLAQLKWISAEEFEGGEKTVVASLCRKFDKWGSAEMGRVVNGFCLPLIKKLSLNKGKERDGLEEMASPPLLGQNVAGAGTGTSDFEILSSSSEGDHHWTSVRDITEKMTPFNAVAGDKLAIPIHICRPTWTELELLIARREVYGLDFGHGYCHHAHGQHADYQLLVSVP